MKAGILAGRVDERAPAASAPAPAPPPPDAAAGDGRAGPGEGGMPVVRRNLLANVAGQGWAAVMAVAFVPAYIRFLGIEAYGLIGVFTLLQAWLTLLDMGITPTLGREMARYTAGAHTAQSIRDLLRSLELLCWALAALVAAGIWAASGFLAGDWLRAQRLPTGVVAQAVALMGLVAALRFCEGVYRGALFGLQKQVRYNALNAVLVTLRFAGVLAVLAWVSPTIQAFFLWQGLVSVAAVAVLAVSVHRALPRAPRPPRFSPAAVRDVWRFAGGMTAITVLALLLTQTDKLLLSRMLPLDAFGYYALAGTVAGVLYFAAAPITQAFSPRLVELHVRESGAELAAAYHQGAQLVTVLAAPAGLLLGFFAGGVIFMWSGDAELARNTSAVLSVLALGTLLNTLVYMPYQLQLAHGWTGLALRGNLVAVALLVPGLFWVVPRWGAVGAAWMWLALNAGYVAVSVQLMHRRLLPAEKGRWYLRDVLLPAGGALAVMLAARALQPAGLHDRAGWLLFLLGTGAAATGASVLLADRLARGWLPSGRRGRARG